jgi:biopolymer transport protein ExbB/TolQ
MDFGNLLPQFAEFGDRRARDSAKKGSLSCSGFTDFEGSAQGLRHQLTYRRCERKDTVSQDRDRHTVWGMLGSLGWPLLLGLTACTLFYGAMYQGILGSDFFQRYFATHPVSFVATGMFFVGLAALGLKLVNLVSQWAALHAIAFRTSPEPGMPVDQCAGLLDEWDQLPGSARRSYLGNRLREALEYVERQGSAENLEDELKYLAEMDEVRQHDSYALVRIIIWATPMLGFLGTVIGITRALGDLDPTMLATAIQTAMEGLLAGLYIAFDTTALALSLSIVLMFVQFFADRVETQLLSLVDMRTHEELMGRLAVGGTSRDPQVAVIQRMAREVIESTERLVARQSEIWESTIAAANERWSALVETSAGTVQAGLQQALEGALARFADQLSHTQRQAADQAEQRWEQWQTVLSNNARLLHIQQQEMSKQGEVMARVMEATGDVIKLETTLNANLRSLAGATNFEDTVMSLAAAIHLLNTRLLGDETRRIDLRGVDSKGRAA